MRALLATAFLVCAAQSASGDPKTDYLHYCRGCHLADGSGVAPVVPTLIDEVGRLLALPGGRNYLVRVPGVSQSGMNDVQLAAVLNWVVSEFNAETVPDTFAPYTAEYVATARADVLPDPLEQRAKILATVN